MEEFDIQMSSKVLYRYLLYHAYRSFAGILGFVHPSTGEYLEFEAPLPEDFEMVLQKLRNKG